MGRGRTVKKDDSTKQWKAHVVMEKIRVNIMVVKDHFIICSHSLFSFRLHLRVKALVDSEIGISLGAV